MTDGGAADIDDAQRGDMLAERIAPLLAFLRRRLSGDVRRSTSSATTRSSTRRC